MRPQKISINNAALTMRWLNKLVFAALFSLLTFVSLLQAQTRVDVQYAQVGDVKACILHSRARRSLVADCWIFADNGNVGPWIIG